MLSQAFQKTRVRSSVATDSLETTAVIASRLTRIEVSGRNFVEPVMDQSECGSCYVAAAVRLWAAKDGLVGLKDQGE